MVQSCPMLSASNNNYSPLPSIITRTNSYRWRACAEDTRDTMDEKMSPDDSRLGARRWESMLLQWMSLTWSFTQVWPARMRNTLLLLCVCVYLSWNVGYKSFLGMGSAMGSYWSSTKCPTFFLLCFPPSSPPSPVLLLYLKEYHNGLEAKEATWVDPGRWMH